jgi:hypothetical protein
MGIPPLPPTSLYPLPSFIGYTIGISYYCQASLHVIDMDVELGYYISVSAGGISILNLLSDLIYIQRMLHLHLDAIERT